MQRLALLCLAAVIAAVAAPTAGAAGFSSSISPIPRDMRRAMIGVSWHKGCPVGLGQLRLITATHRTPDGGTATGRIVVNREVAGTVRGILKRLWDLGFPITRMEPVDVYGGDDWRSIEADNTSSFNCRAATGSSNWSNHAYGYAIDLNPLENPYIENGRVFHTASKRYIDRSRRLSPLEVLPGDRVVRAFAAAGWGWGGDWKGGVLDTQHFSVNGR
ncbi:MAG: M15 family metallopeptidase [Gaiellales bacterium]